MRPEMQKLVAALLDPGCNFIPYFRDLHLAYTFDLEPQFQLLSFQLEVPILAEGERKTIQSMLEETPELSQQFLTINSDCQAQYGGLSPGTACPIVFRRS